jgi:hypothetical protein
VHLPAETDVHLAAEPDVHLAAKTHDPLHSSLKVANHLSITMG